jgi:hypothetical protein
MDPIFRRDNFLENMDQNQEAVTEVYSRHGHKELRKRDMQVLWRNIFGIKTGEKWVKYSSSEKWAVYMTRKQEKRTSVTYAQMCDMYLNSWLLHKRVTYILTLDFCTNAWHVS